MTDVAAAPSVKAPEQVPALLLMAQYAETLAGVRCLGSHGVPVVIATSELFAPARWSPLGETRGPGPRLRCMSYDPAQVLDAPR